MQNAQTELYDGSQQILQNWYARRQKDSYEFQQLALKVAQSKSPTEATTAWMEWSEQTMTSLSEEFRDLWSLTSKSVAIDTKAATPVKVLFDSLAAVSDASGEALKAVSKVAPVPAAKQASKVKRAAPAKPADEAKAAPKAKRAAAAKATGKAKPAPRAKRAMQAKQAPEAKLVQKNAKKSPKRATRTTKTSKK